MIKQLIIPLKFHLSSTNILCLKEPNLQSNFDRLRTFCNKELVEITSFLNLTLGLLKVENYLKNNDTTKATGADNFSPILYLTTKET